MSYATIRTSVDGSVATITLNRPERMNSISTTMRTELLDALGTFSAGDLIRVVRLKGEGRCFSAGYDLEDGYATGPVEDSRQDDRPEWRESRISTDLAALRRMSEWALAVRQFRKPLVAQIHGFCLAGGLDLAGAADAVFTAHDTKIGHPAARGLGLPPTLGLLPLRIGMLNTKHLLFTGDVIDGKTAQQWGFANESVPFDDLDRHVSEYCARVALMPVDLLVVHKAATNRWFDLMGLRTAIDSTVELSAMAHESAFLSRFGEIASESGVKAALAWRDGPYQSPAS